MDADLHRILKALAVSYGMTISELVTLSTEVQLNRLGLRCLVASEVFNLNKFPISHKVQKWCWGSACLNCKLLDECNRSEYDGTFVSKKCDDCVEIPGDKAPGVPRYIDDKYVEPPST